MVHIKITLYIKPNVCRDLIKIANREKYTSPDNLPNMCSIAITEFIKNKREFDLKYRSRENRWYDDLETIK